MGIEISLWRARVGTFSQPIKCKTTFPVLRVNGVLLCVRVLLFLLLAVNGVETNPGPGSGSGAAEKGRGGSAASRGRGRGDSGESNQRLLRSNSSSSHGGAQGHAMRSSSPRNSTYSSMASTQPPINQWLNNSGGMISSPGQGASPGLFGPSRFQSPSYMQPIQPNFQSGSDISELKQIMIDVQNSVKNMEGRFTQFESSLKEVKETSDRLIVSNNKISEEVNCLSKKVTKLESDLKVSEEKRERLEAQSRRENLRIYGLSEDRNESWDDTENKVREYMSRDLELNGDDISIERAHRIQGSEKPRPLIVKFSFYKDKDRVLKTYRQKRKNANELIKERETEQQSAGNENENPDVIDFGHFRKDVTVCEDFPG